MISRVVRIENELGLHARAAAKLVKLTSQFESEVKLTRLNSRQEIDGKSILGVLLLAAPRGTAIQISVQGKDEEQAMEAIARLVESKFGERK